MLLILNEPGVIAGIVAIFSALILYLSGGVLGSYRGRARTMLREIIIWLALGLGLMLYIYKDNLVIAARALRSLVPHASQP